MPGPPCPVLHSETELLPESVAQAGKEFPTLVSGKPESVVCIGLGIDPLFMVVVGKHFAFLLIVV